MLGKYNSRKSYADLDRPRGQQLSKQERTEILTLYGYSKWNADRIARQLRLPYSTVRLCIKSRYYTPQKHRGRLPILTTQKRRRLVQRATLNAFHRRLSYPEIAQIEGIQACKRSLIAAFEKEKYHRRTAQEKPFLIPENMETCL